MRKVIVAVVLLAACGVVFAAWRSHRASSANSQTAFELYGNIDIRQVQLAFRVNGKVQEVLLDEGDIVTPGMIVARLDKKPYQDSLMLALALRDVTAAALDKAVNGPRQGEIEEARASVAELAANLDMAELTFERYGTLASTNAIAKETYDQAVATRDAARGRLKAGTEALNLLLEGTRAEDLDAARAEVRAAEASVAAARTSLADTDLVAPSAGVIVSRVREPGAIVGTGETVAVVSLAEPVWARVYVPEPLLGFVNPGRKVQVRTDTDPNKLYQGVIGFVSPVAEFTPKSVETPELRTALVYRVRVVIAEPDTGLRQGMPVTVIIPRQQDPHHAR